MSGRKRGHPRKEKTQEIQAPIALPPEMPSPLAPPPPSPPASSGVEYVPPAPIDDAPQASVAARRGPKRPLDALIKKHRVSPLAAPMLRKQLGLAAGDMIDEQTFIEGWGRFRKQPLGR
ncbi:hypothetical protein K8I61_17275 [bacterium]|nr:hypothetical protein [bacterium]